MKRALMWFRRDLRLTDNAALHRALCDCDQVFCCFCFDREILDRLEDRADRRVEFIHQCVACLDARLKQRQAGLIVRHGRARDVIPGLARELGVATVYANHDYEPHTRARDDHVSRALERDGRKLLTFKDHVIFERSEILNRAGRPYRVYTQYRNAWRAALTELHHRPHPCERHDARLARPPRGIRSDPWRLTDLGFDRTGLPNQGSSLAARGVLDEFLMRIGDYPHTRDYPAVSGTSRLSVHLRFGTIGIREVLSEALDHGSVGAQKWIDELIWREFHNMILHHFPRIETQPFQPAFDAFPWRHDRRRFRAWCEGHTGYPIVDAGMRELNTTGWMHNRLRMITASFLTKDLLIDWKWGERYFARKLIDFDLSQNLGGWQWSAGIGTDAQPFFRIFNPVTQSIRFDPDGEYIRRHVPELAALPAERIHTPWTSPPSPTVRTATRTGRGYPPPIVDHAQARIAALDAMRVSRGSSRD